MKRMNGRTLRLFAAAATAALAVRALAYTEVVDGIEWSYVLNAGSATVVDPSCRAAIPASTSGAIAIPAKLGGCPVTAVGDLAFVACVGLTDVKIPDCVTSIGDSAFVACSGLRDVTIPNSVTQIGKYAFGACDAITNATIPQAVCAGHLSEVFPSAYRTIKSVVVSDGVTAIGDYLFNDCAGLESVKIPDSVASVGEGAFSGCPAALFDTATMPGVWLVDGWAVGYDGELAGELDLTGVRGIGACAFEECSGIERVRIPDGVKGIGYGAFAGCADIKDVTIPASVTNIGEYAFWYCGGLTNIVFMGDAPAVGEAAFQYVSQDCIAYVSPFSSGWGVEDGGKWHGLTVRYMEEPEGDPEFEIVGVAVEQKAVRRFIVDVAAKIDGNVVSADPSQVVFEATSDLSDWDGAAKLTPIVDVLGTDASGIMTFAVTPGDGTAPCAFLRIRK